MKIENMERACEINEEIGKLKLALSALSDGGVIKCYSSRNSSSGCIELPSGLLDLDIKECIQKHICKLELEIETL